MPSSRPNLTRDPLTMDEQSFQGLLSAAFTIQEHNDRRKQVLPVPEAEVEPEEVEPEQVPLEQAKAAETREVCPRCGTFKLANEVRCGNCGLEEMRPGERLQRNWASMWLMSQKQGLWPERPAEPELNGEREIEPETRTSSAERHPVEPKPHAADFAMPEFADLLASGANAIESESSTQRGVEESQPEDTYPQTREGFVGAGLSLSDPKWAEEPYQLPDSEGLKLALSDENSDAGESGRSKSRPKLGDWRVTLRFHRADLYLGISILVAIVALVLPAASPATKPGLSTFDRALVQMGIAEAPAPAIHYQGDPAAKVWVDPHTALYYCGGEEQYGKTADGRFSTQRDAQSDRFEPANRSACE